MVKKKRGKGHIVEESKPVESMHLSVNYFCKEIAGLLREVGKLFNLEEGSSIIVESSSNPDVEHLQCPIEKSLVFKKNALSRKLEKMLLEK